MKKLLLAAVALFGITTSSIADIRFNLNIDIPKLYDPYNDEDFYSREFSCEDGVTMLYSEGFRHIRIHSCNSNTYVYECRDYSVYYRIIMDHYGNIIRTKRIW